MAYTEIACAAEQTPGRTRTGSAGTPRGNLRLELDGTEDGGEGVTGDAEPGGPRSHSVDSSMRMLPISKNTALTLQGGPLAFEACYAGADRSAQPSIRVILDNPVFAKVKKQIHPSSMRVMQNPSIDSRTIAG